MGEGGKEAKEGLGASEKAEVAAPAPAYPSPRTLIDIEPGLAFGAPGVGWHLGLGISPSDWAFSNHWTEGRIGAMAAIEQLNGSQRFILTGRISFGIGHR